MFDKKQLLVDFMGWLNDRGIFPMEEGYEDSYDHVFDFHILFDEFLEENEGET